MIFELEGGKYDIESEREARNGNVIQEATKRPLLSSEGTGGSGKERYQLMILYPIYI